MKKTLITVFGSLMKPTFNLAAVVALFGAVQVHGQSVVFDFEDGTDQGFGTGFGNDASATFPIVNIGGSLRMGVTLGGFQVAAREGGSGPFLDAMNAAAANPSGYYISYDWYVDTSLSPGNYGNFLQLGTYFNSGSGAYSQDFPGTGKDVELDGTQLGSGGVFSGTVTETLTQKYGELNPGHVGQTFQRLGFIMNGDGAATIVYFDNISITAVPEPSALALSALGAAAGMLFRRRCKP
jgi:hypothetical protein